MRSVRTRALALSAAALAVTAGSLAGQTPATSVGLGYPVPPLDARAAGLGGTGVGLLGGTFSIGNPADLVEFTRPALSVSPAPEGVSPAGTGESTGRNRFSTLRAVVPLGEWAASVSFGSELDQDWKFTSRDTLDISTGRFPFEERREHDGGVSTVDVSLARGVGPVSAGVSYQYLTGGLRQDLRRRFDPSVDEGLNAPRRVSQSSVWNYSGWRLTGGVGLEVADRVRVSGAYVFGADLTAERDSVVTLAGDQPRPVGSRTFRLPPSARVGASALLTDDWMVALGGGWSRWSEADGGLEEERARDVYRAGGGVEFRGLELGAVPIVVRAGGRWRELPFVLPGREAADESALTAGLGTRVAGGSGQLDVGFELGSRGDRSRTGFEESFRRLTITATIRQ